MTDSGHHVVSKLTVRGGFLDGATIEFAPGLNCLIGGRGAGKTTALELLRYGLGLMPSAKTDGARLKVIDGLIKKNLGDGRIAVDIVTRSGMRYTAGRAYGEAVQVINEHGTGVPLVLDRDHVFSADVFSQNEIEDIALSPAAQLELIDRFDDANIDAINRELVETKHVVQDNAKRLQRLDQEIDELQINVADLPILRERLRAFSSAPGTDADRLNAAHEAKASRAREAQLPLSLLAALMRLQTELRESEANFKGSMGALTGTPYTGVNEEVLGELYAAVNSLTATVRAAVVSVAAAVDASDEAVRRLALRLSERHAEQEGNYREILEASDEEAGRARERALLQENLARAEAAASVLAVRVEQRSKILDERRISLNRASELRDKRFGLRQSIAHQLTDQFESLRVTVEQDADSSLFQDSLAARLRGANVKPGMTAENIAKRFVPVELANALARRDVDLIASRCDFDADRARKTADALSADGGSYAIEEIELADCPHIELKDGTQYKEAANLSTGQRCTTILPLLLLQSERPLLVDQPEDNLDNAFIYATVVKALRSVRGKRQVIFVTHNPNIPVLGEAERVFVFASDGQHSVLRQVGSVDDCKVDIEQILEGGPEAFLERKTRYGH